MGMDLIGNHGDVRFSAGGWDMCLERAIEFGWKPEGTVAPTDFVGEWKGGYATNDFQVVTDRDAHALGESLLRAVAALSARAKVQDRSKWSEDAFDVPEGALDDEIRCLRRFSDYALKGGFVIA